MHSSVKKVQIFDQVEKTSNHQNTVSEVEKNAVKKKVKKKDKQRDKGW